jgi:mRNA interferase MazF
MKPEPKRKEIWLVDLGLAAKVRPVLVLSIPIHSEDRALITVIAHTTAQRNSRFEVSSSLPFLRNGVFDVQNILSIPSAKFIRKLGEISVEDLQIIEARVAVWLGITTIH